MTTDIAHQARKRIEQFTAHLDEYDDARIREVHDAVEASSIASAVEPDLSVDDWLFVLRELAGDAYATATERNYGGYSDDWSVTWYLRHDGETYVYGTEDTGELYRGEQARRQLKSVVSNHETYCRPMSQYPLEAEIAEEADR